MFQFGESIHIGPLMFKWSTLPDSVTHPKAPHLVVFSSKRAKLPWLVMYILRNQGKWNGGARKPCWCFGGSTLATGNHSDVHMQFVSIMTLRMGIHQHQLCWCQLWPAILSTAAPRFFNWQSSIISAIAPQWEPKFFPWQSTKLPSGNPTWQWKMDHSSVMFSIKPPFSSGIFQPAMFDHQR